MDRDRSRIVSTPKLRLCSFDEDQAAWQELMKSAKDKTLYHRHSWIRLLSTAYGFQSWLATLHKDGRIICGLRVRAHPRLSRQFVALPFSDACPPLALKPKRLTAYCARSRWTLHGVGLTKFGVLAEYHRGRRSSTSLTGG